MATAREYFEKNFSQNLRTHQTQLLSTTDGETVEVVAGVVLDFEANAKFAAVYVPETPVAATVVRHYLENIDNALKAGEGVETIMGFDGSDEAIHSQHLVFTGRITVYTVGTASAEAKKELFDVAAKQKLNLVLRDGAYVAARNRFEKPAAFISHDSRDKASFVAELASKLQSMLCPVWYDEYSLVPGASLRARPRGQI